MSDHLGFDIDTPRCRACASTTCPGIAGGVDACPEWQAAEARNARGEYLPTTPGPTLAMLADPSLGACRAFRPGVCGELGPWRPFYQGYVCDPCLRADEADILAHRLPEWWARERKRRDV
jgi:hypothetical protein